MLMLKKGIMVFWVMAAVFNFVGCGDRSSSDTTSEVTSLAAGVASKGPFKEGSVVIAYKLNSDGTRSETSAKTLTTDNKGNYSFEEGLPWSGPTEFVIYGEYLNENTGKYMVLTEDMGLSSVVDLEENKTVKANINIFTDMEADSIKAKMSGGVSFSDAKLESQNNIKKIFNISSDVKYEELDLTDGTDNVEANTKLLIISSALLKTVNPEDTLKKLAEDLSDGDLNGVSMAVFDDLKEKVSSVDIKEVAINIEDTIDVNNVPNSESVLNGTLSLDNNISFKDTYDVDLDSSYISNEVIIDGIYGGSGDISVENSEYSIDGSEFVSTAGSVSNGQKVRVKLLSPNEYSTKTEAKVTIAGVTFSYNVVTKTDPNQIDTTPNLFDFGYKKDVTPNVVVESQVVRVTGLSKDTTTPISINNGKYKINDGDWTSADGVVSNEDNVTVQVIAGGVSTQTTSVVTIGGVEGKFNVFTIQEDKTPDSSVSFNEAKDVNISTEVVSNPIIITGINTVVPVTIDNGSFSIDGTVFVTEANVTDGASIQVKLTSASDWGKETVANLKVNNTIFTFKVKTMSDPTIIDATPDEFRFTTLVNQNISAEVQSEAVVISGINTNVGVSVENGEYSIDGSAFTSEDGNISVGQSIVIKQITANEFNTEKITTLTIGGVSGTFKTITVEEDKVPEPLSFESKEEVSLDADIVSNTVTIAGINTQVDISVENGEYSINGEDFISSPGTVENGDTLTLRHTSASTPETVTTTYLTVGTTSFLFSSKTMAEPSIDDTQVVNSATQGVLYEFIPLLKDNSSPVNSWSIENKPSWVEFNSTTGRLYGTPTNDDVGIDKNIIIIATNEAGSDSLSFDLTVLNVNDAPIANDANITVNEDESSTINLLSLVQDVDIGDELSITTVTNPINGSIVNNGDGTVTYTSNANYNGSDSFTYTVSDSAGITATATVTITVTPVNDAPVAESLSLSVDEDNTLSGSLSANDIDGDSLTYSLVNASTDGNVTIDANTGAFTFTPNTNFTGEITFSYKVNDGSLDSNEATVTITVTPVNDAPVAAEIEVSTDEDTPLTLELSSYVTDIDSNSITYYIDTEPTHGTITIDSASGKLVYVPDQEYSGIEYFTYHVVDDYNASSDVTEAHITVNAVNDAPTISAIPDQSILEDSGSHSVDINVSDIDNNVSTLTVTAVSSDDSIVRVDANTSAVTFTTVDDAYGDVNITVTVSDGDLTATAIILVTVSNVNDAPVANDANITVNEDESSNINLLSLVQDVDVGDELNITTVTNPTNGIIVNNGDGTVTYTPNANFNGSDSFTYTVSDGNFTDTATINITVNPVNDAPIARDLNVTMNEDTSIDINVTTLFTDIDMDDNLSIRIASLQNNGMIVFDGDIYTYTPREDYYGTDDFSVTATDSNGATATAYIYITVSNVNDAPIAYDMNITAVKNSSYIGILDASDIDGDSLIYTIVDDLNGSGTLRLDDNTRGVFTYTPDVNFTGVETFTFKVTDPDNNESNVATVTLEVVDKNISVEAVNDSVTLAEDTNVTVNVLANDNSYYDDDNSNATGTIVSAVSTPAHGRVEIVLPNSVQYIPELNYNGTDSFTYTARTLSGDEANATVTVTVTPVNDAPDILSDLRTAPINEDSNYFRVITIIDLDGDDFTFDANSSNTSIVTANITRLDTYYFQLDLNTTANANGQVTICVTADDGNTSTSECFPLIIYPVNDAPTISAIPDQNILEDSGFHSIDIDISDIDNNVSTLTVTAASSDDSIVTVYADTSAITFTTVNDAYGDVNITVTVSDGDLNASTTFGVHVENMPESVSGRVMVDDYVANAKLYVYDDISRTNLIVSGTTDENGSFDIELSSQYDEVPSPLYIHSVGGTIISSAMVAPNMDIIAYSYYPYNITPLTTLLNDWYFNFYDSYDSYTPNFIDAIGAVRSQTDLTDTDVYSDTTMVSDASVAMQNYILNGNFMTSTLSDGNYTMSMLSFGAGDVGDVSISGVEDLESKISTYTFSVTNGVIQGNSDESISGVVSGTTVVLDINKTDGSFVSIAGSVGLFGSSSGVSSFVASDGTTQKGFFVAQFIPEDISDEQKSFMKKNLLITVDCRKDFVYRIAIGDMVKMGIGSLSDLANEDDTTITLFEDDINIIEGDGRLDFADFDTNESRFMLNGNNITSFATRVFNLHDGNSSSDSLQAKVYLIQPIGVRKALVVATDPSSGEIVGIGNSYISTQGALALPDAGIGANSSYKFSIAKVHSGMIGGTRDDMLAEQMIDDPMEINTTMESNTSDYRPVLSALRVQPDLEQNSTNITLLSGSVWGLYNDTNQNDLNDSNDSMHIVQIYQSGAFDGEAIVGGVSDEGEKLKNYPGVFVGSIYYNSASSTTNKIFVKIPFISTQNFVMRPLYVDDTSKLGKILYGKITLDYSDANLSIEGQDSVNLSNSFDYDSGMYHLEGTLDDATYIDIMWPTWGKKAVYTISDSNATDATVTEVGEAYFSF